jgi:hypothetical protein
VWIDGDKPPVATHESQPGIKLMGTMLLLLALTAGGHPRCVDCPAWVPGINNAPPGGCVGKWCYYHYWAFHGANYQRWYEYDYYRQFDYPWHDPRRREPPPIEWLQGPTRVRSLVGPPSPLDGPRFIPVEETVPGSTIEIIEPDSPSFDYPASATLSRPSSRAAKRR